MIRPSEIDDNITTGISTTFPNLRLPQYPMNKSLTVLGTIDQNRSLKQLNGCLFDPHCSECIREVWGPLLSPFVYLIKQNTEHFNEILERFGKNKINSSSISISHDPVHTPKLEYDDHKFLSPAGMCAFRSVNVSWLIVWTFAFFLFIVAISVAVFSNSFLPPLVAILRMDQAADWGMKITLNKVAASIVISLIETLKMLASLLGLIAVTRRTEKLIIGTLMLISLPIVFDIGLLVYVLAQWSQIVNRIKTTLENSFHNHYGAVNSASITSAWDRVFQDYECCGWMARNFTNTPWVPGSPLSIPYSCCRPGAPYPDCAFISALPSENYANQGCLDAIQESIQSTAYVPIALTSFCLIILFEVISAVLTRVYSSTLKLASHRRLIYNEKKMQKFHRSKISNREDPPVNNLPRIVHRTYPHQVQASANGQNHAYKQLTEPRGIPLEIDSSVIPITPTVVQVKRPDIYSYFYYE